MFVDRRSTLWEVEQGGSDCGKHLTLLHTIEVKYPAGNETMPSADLLALECCEAIEVAFPDGRGGARLGLKL